MAWVKVPQENHPLFHTALPRDPRITTLKMFGSVCAMVNGNMMGGLFARSAMVRLGPADQKEALALDGAEPFDPMGNGRIMNDMIMLPEQVMDEPGQLRAWLRKAFELTVTLPPKVKKAKSAAKGRPTAKGAAKGRPTPKTKAKTKTKPAPKTKAKTKPAPKTKAKTKPARSKARPKRR